MESNRASITKTINLLHGRITVKISFYPDSSACQGDDLGKEDRPSSEEIDLTVVEVGRDQTNYLQV